MKVKMPVAPAKNESAVLAAQAAASASPTVKRNKAAAFGVIKPN